MKSAMRAAKMPKREVDAATSYVMGPVRMSVAVPPAVGGRPSLVTRCRRRGTNARGRAELDNEHETPATVAWSLARRALASMAWPSPSGSVVKRIVVTSEWALQRRTTCGAEKVRDSLEDVIDSGHGAIIGLMTIGMARDPTGEMSNASIGMIQCGKIRRHIGMKRPTGQEGPVVAMPAATSGWIRRPSTEGPQVRPHHIVVALQSMGPAWVIRLSERLIEPVRLRSP